MGIHIEPSPPQSEQPLKRVTIMPDEAQCQKRQNLYHYDVGNHLHIQMQPEMCRCAGGNRQNGSAGKASQLAHRHSGEYFFSILRNL